MDHLATLLETLGGIDFAKASRVGDGGQFALVLDDDVAAMLSACESDEYCLLTAGLSTKLPAAAATEGASPWLRDVPDPDGADGFDQVSIDPASGEVVLQRCVHRSRMDAVRFPAELARFVQRYRSWESVLLRISSLAAGGAAGGDASR